jgi:hypothetical protein
MRARKHDCAPGNTNSPQQVGSVLKFLANFQKKGSDKAKEKNRKICCSISLFVKVTNGRLTLALIKHAILEYNITMFRYQNIAIILDRSVA